MEFFETSLFTKYVYDYLTEDEFRRLQYFLIANPEAGDLIPDTGGFRKLRWSDSKRNKGKRGGLRIIYYFLSTDGQIWLFMIYDKSEAADLTANQRKQLKEAIATELKERSKRK